MTGLYYNSVIYLLYQPHPISSLLSQQSTTLSQRYWCSTHSPLLHRNWPSDLSHSGGSSHPLSSSPCKHSFLELHLSSGDNHRPSWQRKNVSFGCEFGSPANTIQNVIVVYQCLMQLMPVDSVRFGCLKSLQKNNLWKEFLKILLQKLNLPHCITADLLNENFVFL